MSSLDKSGSLQMLPKVEISTLVRLKETNREVWTVGSALSPQNWSTFSEVPSLVSAKDFRASTRKVSNSLARCNRLAVVFLHLKTCPGVMLLWSNQVFVQKAPVQGIREFNCFKSL